jgi:hypothetical protein
MWTRRGQWASSPLRCCVGHGLLPDHPQRNTQFYIVQKTGSYFHLHLVSDATGETLITVARAATAQYAKVMPVEHIYPLIRTQKQLDRVLAELESAPGIVLYTLLEDDLVTRLEEKCRELSLPCMSILGPVLQLLQSYLGSESTHRVGAQHTLNAEYFKRIDALNYTMLHDDGQHPDGLEEADVVLLGVSRTCRSCRACHTRLRSRRSRGPSLLGFTPARSASCRSGRTGCWAYARAKMIINISTATRWRRKSPSRGNFAPSTTGR